MQLLTDLVFRVLLLNQLIEATGASTQFSVLPFVVSYVIDPEFNKDGTRVPDSDGLEDLTFTLLGGGLLVFVSTCGPHHNAIFSNKS